MTGYTQNLSLPYPEPADYVSDSQATMQELAEAIDAALPTVAAGAFEPSASAYTVAPYLIDTIETSGGWVAPDVNGDGSSFVCDLVIICPGAHQAYESGAASTWGSHGGNGGRAWLIKSVRLAAGATFDVVVGFTGTGTSFAGREVPYGAGPAEPEPYGDRYSNGYAFNNSTQAFQGYPGCQITPLNGQTFGVCGGGSSGPGGSGGTQPVEGMPGVDGGGASGRNGYGSSTYRNRCEGGARGRLGGGAGGRGGGGDGTTHVHLSAGSIGAVLVFGHRPMPARRRVPVEPVIVAALDRDGRMVGAYAVDPAAPTLRDLSAVTYPDSPQPTGQLITEPVDPADPDGPTHEVPELAWPVAGWSYDNGQWKPPTQEVTG